MKSWRKALFSFTLFGQDNECFRCVGNCSSFDRLALCVGFCVPYKCAAMCGPLLGTLNLNVLSFEGEVVLLYLNYFSSANNFICLVIFNQSKSIEINKTSDSLVLMKAEPTISKTIRGLTHHHLIIFS